MPSSVRPTASTSLAVEPHQTGLANFTFPDGRMVPIEGAGQGFYRDRRSQQICLNRRQGTLQPTGRYHCEIPNANGVHQKLLFQLV